MEKERSIEVNDKGMHLKCIGITKRSTHLHYIDRYVNLQHCMGLAVCIDVHLSMRRSRHFFPSPTTPPLLFRAWISSCPNNFQENSIVERRGCYLLEGRGSYYFIQKWILIAWYSLEYTSSIWCCWISFSAILYTSIQ